MEHSVEYAQKPPDGTGTRSGGVLVSKTPARRSLLSGAFALGTLAGGAAFGGTAHAVGTTPSAPDADTTGYAVDVTAHGADPTGATASDAAFKAAAAEVLASFQPGPISGAIPKKTLVIPPGNYLLTQPDSLLPNVDGSAGGGVVDGISITGSGKRLSRIVYSPTTNGTTLWTNNQRYKNVRISGLTFTSTNATSSFNYAYSSASYGVQDTWYNDVEWRGSWTRGIGLDGPTSTSNLNSEMGWDHCQVGGSYSDAFLVMGMTPAQTQQDQFLNYWFRDCKIEYESGVFVKNQRGGSMNFTGGSYILTDSTSTGTFFSLSSTATTRSDSVLRLYAEGIRFELRGANHKVIDCGWYKGSITFVSCDDTALAYQSWGATALTHAYNFSVGGSRGPMVRYQDCALMGYHQVTTATTATTSGKVLYDGCRVASQSTGAGTGTTGFLRWTKDNVAPYYEFRDCLTGSTRLQDTKSP